MVTTLMSAPCSPDRRHRPFLAGGYSGSGAGLCFHPPHTHSSATLPAHTSTNRSTPEYPYAPPGRSTTSADPGYPHGHAEVEVILVLFDQMAHEGLVAAKLQIHRFLGVQQSHGPGVDVFVQIKTRRMLHRRHVLHRRHPGTMAGTYGVVRHHLGDRRRSSELPRSATADRQGWAGFYGLSDKEISGGLKNQGLD